MSSSMITVHLRHFSKSELLFDAQETKDILTFFFPSERALISGATITDSLREFAQGLLVAAINASYEMGWVEVLWKSTASPGIGVKKAIKKLAVNGAKYWFKSVKNKNDLLHAKIYESVRSALSIKFRSILVIKLVAKDDNSNSEHIATIHAGDSLAKNKVWD